MIVETPTQRWALKILKDLQDSSFYGRIILEFKAGRLVLLRQEQTIKPPDIQV
jgi:hypothetical protein